MNDYVPIDCGLHSEYELAIMQHRKLAIRWLEDEQTEHSATVIPLDLYTRNSEEFLLVRNPEGNEQPIRLDRITACKIL